MACPALAADYDDSWLRGSQVIGPAAVPPPRLYRIWAGVYGGGQVGEDFRGVDFRGIPAPAIASAIDQDAILTDLKASLPGMPALPVFNSKGPSYGGFLGYNWQIDDVVFGLELNANRASLDARATNSVTRSYIVVNGTSTYAPTTVNITSTGPPTCPPTARCAAGWAGQSEIFCPTSSPASRSPRSTVPDSST
jgi:hypothetical protein